MPTSPNQGNSSNEAELAADISASLTYASDLNKGGHFRLQRLLQDHHPQKRHPRA